MDRTRGGWMRRMLVSRAFAAILFVLMIVATLWSMRQLALREQQRTADEAATIAQVVVRAAVDAHLDAHAAAAGRLSPEAEADLLGDIEQLRRSGQLSGLGIWRLDGAELFQSSTPGAAPMRPQKADLQRARLGLPWVASSTGPDGQSQLHVFVPDDANRAAASAPVSLVAVDLPRATVAGDGVGGLLRRQLTVIVALVLVAGGWCWLRRRLRRRGQRAQTDLLTGLPNRWALHEAGARPVAAASQHRPAALLLIDLAEFKTVNDTLGHAAGDQLLRQVAGALREWVRASDLVVRLGGDEFAILLTDLPDAAAAQLRAEHLLAQLRRIPFTVDDIALSVDASVGVVHAPQHGRTVEELLRCADVAMYQAKRGHRGTMLYDPATDGHTVGQLELVAELRRALENAEFVLHYQPKISLPERQAYGVEALVRWQHPTRGLLSPDQFLPLMESTGLIQPLSEWVLREAAQQAADWRRVGMPLKVAVNLSTRSLLSPALPAKVLATLAGADLPADQLELEITETAIMANPERAARILGQLRARGIDVSIDDFGVGYTSLAFLRILPVTALKIDRSLVSQMLDCDQDQAVTEAVIALGHRLGLRVIAEGVESQALLDRLTTLGCDRAQGYGISPPLTADELEGWLAARSTGTTAVAPTLG